MRFGLCRFMRRGCNCVGRGWDGQRRERDVTADDYLLTDTRQTMAVDPNCDRTTNSTKQYLFLLSIITVCRPVDPLEEERGGAGRRRRRSDAAKTLRGQVPMKLCHQICRHHFRQQTLDNACQQRGIAHMDLGDQQTEVPKYLPYFEGFAFDARWPPLSKCKPFFFEIWPSPIR